MDVVLPLPQADQGRPSSPTDCPAADDLTAGLDLPVATPAPDAEIPDATADHPPLHTNRTAGPDHPLTRPASAAEDPNAIAEPSILHHTPDPSAEDQPAFRWSRREQAKYLHEFQATIEDTSQRQFAQQVGIPHSTFNYWLNHAIAPDLPTPLVQFFNSPDGLDFLQRVVVALHLVFGIDAGCGIRKICRFLELTHLHHWVANSYGVQQLLSVHMQEEIPAFAQQEQQRLGPGMPPKTITLCQDENFHEQICLVAIEPVSGFLLVEVYAEHRDAATWNAVVAAAVAGLPVTVLQCTSDEASGLKEHCQQGLQAHHSPDLFHVQQDLGHAASGPLQSQLRQAAQELEQARAELEELQRQRADRHDYDPSSLRDCYLAQRIAQSEQRLAEATAGHQACQERYQQFTDARHGISAADHPVDLETGQPQTAAQAQQQFQEHFETIQHIAAGAHLSERCLALIAKAWRVVPGLVATIAFFWLRIRKDIEHLDLPECQETVLLEQLLPAYYLLRVADKVSPAAHSHILRERAKAMLQHARDGPLAEVPAEQRQRLEEAAAAGAALFQRSSSCVEGRNGYLALWHHSLHHLSARRLAALTALHNYFHRHSDGTTAAERFFGQPQGDLFAWLLTRIKEPARPAA